MGEIGEGVGGGGELCEEAFGSFCRFLPEACVGVDGDDVRGGFERGETAFFEDALQNGFCGFCAFRPVACCTIGVEGCDAGDIASRALLDCLSEAFGFGGRGFGGRGEVGFEMGFEGGCCADGCGAACEELFEGGDDFVECADGPCFDGVQLRLCSCCFLGGIVQRGGGAGLCFLRCFFFRGREILLCRVSRFICGALGGLEGAFGVVSGFGCGGESVERGIGCGFDDGFCAI